MRASTRRELVAGPAGRLECAVDEPEGTARGVALIAHPHPLYGGSLDNKVVQTLARAFVKLGYETWRPNFRGVGGPVRCKEVAKRCTSWNWTVGPTLMKRRT